MRAAEEGFAWPVATVRDSGWLNLYSLTRHFQVIDHARRHGHGQTILAKAGDMQLNRLAQ